MIEILITDDHPLLRQGIRRLLEQHEDFKIVGEAANGPEALELARELSPDVVLLDLAMAGGDGLEVLARIKEHASVLVFSMHAEEQYARRVLREGAKGYLNKKAAPEELEKAVRQIHAGEMYLSTSFAGRLAAGLFEGISSARHERLSRREMQVFRRLAMGRPQTEIAKELGISSKTISTHRSRILDKLGLETTAEMIQYALAHGLVVPGDGE